MDQAKKTKTKQPKAPAPSKKKAGFDHLFGVDILEKFVTFSKDTLSPKVLDFSIKWLLKIGHYALIAAAALGFLFTFIYAVRVNSFFAFLYGIAWIVLVFVIQYTAHRFSTAGEKLINNNPSSMSSKAFLDCFGFLAVIGGLIVLVVGILQTIRGAGFNNLFMGIGFFVLLEFLALVAFHPQTVTTNIIKETTAGQEAIGIIVFFLKGLMKLVPIVFGVGIAVGFVLLFIDFIGIFGNEFRVASSWLSGQNSARTILYVGLIPFLSYLFFVLSYLAVDVIRSILATPIKIEELKKK
ncbi:MAG: hypothetical protein JXB26_05285 [Candidatus Aminicenantes bacterium]|nr:hypothetical protein [Candidatus Aminicenantes bacterium]